MRVLVLWADDRSPNLGVRVLGAGAAALAQEAFCGSEVIHLSNGLDTAPMRVGDWHALAKEAVTGTRGLVRWLRGFDLAVDMRGGDSFADLYGLSRLWTMNLLGELVRRAGVPIVLGPQTIGPFQTRTGRLLGRRALRTASAVLARDSLSRDYGRMLGTTPTLASDVVFGLPAPEAAEPRDVVLNVSGLLWNNNPHVDSAHYRNTVRELAEQLLGSGRRVSLLAHVLDSPSPDNDVPAVNALADALGGQSEVIVPDGLESLRAVLGSAQVVIGSRMHACLNALSCGTPAVPLAYSRKFTPLLADIGWPWSVDLRDTPQPVEKVLEAVASPGLAVAAKNTQKLGRQGLDTAVEVLRSVA